MQARFLLGPAGSGKTFRCLEEIRAELLADPAGPPLILIAPKQATFQLERQLLSDPALAGYTRLRIVSFERLAQFVLDELHIAPPEILSEQGRVMVLRALLIRHQHELKTFRASARLAGFAQQLSLLLREFQRHQLQPKRLDDMAARPDSPEQLRAKLHDLALLLRSYNNWLKSHQLLDANSLLDAATDALKTAPRNPDFSLHISRLWLDGFAEMTSQELDLLAAVVPLCDAATFAFCLEREPADETSWLSPWTVVAQTFRRCHARLASIEDCQVSTETIANKPGHGRFGNNDTLRNLEACWSQSSSVSNHTPCPTPQDLRLVTCPDPESESVLAAREILRHVHVGGRFRDCAVIVRSLDPYHAVLDRVFRRYEIPFFMDRREPVAHHPLAELTRFALRTVARGWRHDDWFGALKSGLVPAREEQIDELENEAIARGWEGKVWREPFAITTERPLAERVEQLRRKIVLPFDQLASALAGNPSTGKQVADALRTFWTELKIEATLEQWSEAQSKSAIHSTVLEQMQGWIDNLALAFPAEPLALRDWLPILEAGLAGLTVGIVPPALDQVLIGAVDRSRNPDLKLVVALGLNEGVFPAPPATGTLLTDSDLAGLERQNVYLGPTSRQRLGHERYLAYIACTRTSERLVLTCAAQDARGHPLNPSPFFAQIERITGTTVEPFVSAAPWWEGEHVCELEAPVLKIPDEAGLQHLSVFAPVIQKWRQVQQAAASDTLSIETVKKLFGQELKSSVSALEDFAACPFKFFAARGLRLQERKEFQFDNRDKGSFHHEILELFHKHVTASGRWRDLNVDQAVALVERIAREHLPVYAGGKFIADGSARFTGEVLIERIKKLVAALIAWMPQYGFDPVATEIAFDDTQVLHGALPSWRIDLGDGRALVLRGRIDRVDLCRMNDNTALAVVMDYKSRPRRLDKTRLHHGLELQLLSYLGVLRHLREPEKLFGVKQLQPAGAFYVPLNGGGASGSKSRQEVLDGGDRQHAGYQHSGRFLAEALRHFDNRGQKKGDQFKYSLNKDGGFSARGNDALSPEEFMAQEQKVAAHLRNYGLQIFAGEASVSPFRIGSQMACDYCDFRAVCRFDPWMQPFRHLRPPPKERSATDSA